MSKNISIIDYGSGNMFSIIRALKYLDANIKIIKNEEDIIKSDRIIFPGVGAFSSAMGALKKKEIVGAIQEYLVSDRPFLGICLGMQLLMEDSSEFGMHKGLDIFKGKVIKIPNIGMDGLKHKVPHVGWGSIYTHDDKDWSPTILSGLPYEASLYFVHSYAVYPANLDDMLAYTTYNGIKICSVICRNNIYGCQFHPEKSGKHGLSILDKFLSI